MKPIKIMTWNANGLLKRSKELETLLHVEKIDICLISETHFTNETFVKFKNYKTYCSNHPNNNARGGSAIIIRDNIPHYEEINISVPEFQTTTISVESSFGKISITAIYSPPRHNIKMDLYTELILKHHGKFIMGGDFNAKHSQWGSRVTTPKGRELFKAVMATGCDFMSTGKPTYWPSDTRKLPDLIDFFITRQISKTFITMENGLDLNSDHSPVYLILNGHLKEIDIPPYLSNRHTDWEYFKVMLDKNIDFKVNITTQDILEDEVHTFTKTIQESAWKSTPVPKQKNFYTKYPSDILDLIKKKRKLRKKWQITRFPQYKTELNNLTKILSTKIKLFTNQNISNYIEKLTPNKHTDYSLWKAVKNARKPILSNAPLRKPNGSWAKSDEEKAEVFSEKLTKTFSPFAFNGTLPQLEESQYVGEIQPATNKEVENIIKSRFKPKKAPGFDLVTADVLKNLTRKALEKLTSIINACLNLRYVPLSWKVSEIIMVQKPGKSAQEASSYRPISLLPILSKLLEAVIIRRLQNIIEEKDLIPIHQFGFRSQHSTIDQVHRITSIIEDAMEKKQNCTAVFLDVSQAFDRVWHHGLLHKLRLLFPQHLTELLASYLSNRYFRIKQGQSYTTLQPIKTGVPQGSVLGPLLYILFTSDMPTPPNCTIATFADDTCIITTGKNVVESSNRMQSSINLIVEWTQKWNITLNELKSIHINFTNKTATYIPLYIGNEVIPYSTSAKYLGLTLDAKLKWKEHIQRKVAELKLKYNKINWLIGKKSPLTTSNKILVYNQTLKPIWTYGIQLWGCAAPLYIEAVQRFQNKVLRKIVNAPWYIRNSDLHRDLHIKMVREVIRETASKHATRLQNHVNAEARQLGETRNSRRRLKRTTFHDLLSK
uniref:Reverse transcriptase domain-containing protein n=1 Tax=Bactrocera tryoni TaxID=59916 RepID=A0A142LX49_BACRY|nr:hypothetical protein [Bactrocera tryoni]